MPDLTSQPNLRPTRKVGAGMFASGATVIGCWLLSALAGIEVPLEVALATPPMIGYGFSYFIHDREIEGLPE